MTIDQVERKIAHIAKAAVSGAKPESQIEFEIAELLQDVTAALAEANRDVETSWLIERKRHYWNGAHFTSRPDWAIRFTRREDAEMVIQQQRTHYGRYFPDGAVAVGYQINTHE